jgi:transcriptional regulator with XRE-family HTH domain
MRKGYVKAQASKIAKMMREECKLSQTELSRKLKSAQPAISRAETVGCSLDLLEEIAGACGFEILIKYKNTK